MPVQISLFTSGRSWWRERQGDGAITDTLPKNTRFKAGRATLLSDDRRSVSGLARGGRKGSASTFENNVPFERIFEIESFAVDDIVRAVRPQSHAAVRDVVTKGFGTFSEVASEDIRLWLAQHHPGTGVALEDILDTDPPWMTASPDMAAQYREQSDAINVAAEVAGLDREQVLAGIRLPTTAGHVNLGGTVLTREDNTILNDMRVFPGWEQVVSLNPTGQVFEDVESGRRLTVLLANKNEIERAVGVDLLYYVYEYQSFVLVQYKRVSRDENRRRLVRIDDQLDEQVRRMMEVETALRADIAASSELSDHRLAAGTCYFKLCESHQPREVAELSRGKYLPLSTWNLMARTGLSIGPRGGRSLDYDKVKRYLTNLTFAELVSEGWVGSTSRDFDQLIDLVSTHFEEGRSVVVGALELGNTLRRIPTGEAADSVIPPVTVAGSRSRTRRVGGTRYARCSLDSVLFFRDGG